MRRILCYFICLMVLPKAYALEASFAFDFSGGPIKGYTQIPRGGDYNSTSYQRPTYAEVDINNNFYWDVEADFRYKQFYAFFEFDKIKADKRHALAEDLTSHGQFMPATVLFKKCVHFDWYRAGMGWSFQSPNKRWILTPLYLANFIKFNYMFYAWPKSSGRSFNLITGLFGLDALYKLTPKVTIRASGMSTLPLSNLTIYNALMAIEYAFIDTPALKFIPRFGIEYIEIDYQDEQNIPNHFRYEAKPHAMIGVKLLFSQK